MLQTLLNIPTLQRKLITPAFIKRSFYVKDWVRMLCAIFIL
jgi:hypothetical protein